MYKLNIFNFWQHLVNSVYCLRVGFLWGPLRGLASSLLRCSVIVADTCFKFELRQVNYLPSIFYIKINCIHHNFNFYYMWIYALSHFATKTIRAPCYHKFYFDFQSPLLAYSSLALPAWLLLTLPVSIMAAANTANTLFTHIYHCFTVTCFNGGFLSTFEGRWGHVRAAFVAAGAGGRGEADWRAGWEAGPAWGSRAQRWKHPGLMLTSLG